MFIYIVTAIMGVDLCSAGDADYFVKKCCPDVLTKWINVVTEQVKLN